MNMISTGAFQTEMDASNKQLTLAKKFAAVWEKKNAKAARAGGVSLMALSLAACGSSDDATTAVDTTATDTTDTTTTTPVAPTPVSKSMTAYQDTLEGTAAGDQFQGIYVADGGTGTTAFAGDIVNGGDGADTLTINVSGTSTAAQSITGITTSGVETLVVRNFDANATDSEDTTVDMALMSGVTKVDFTGSIGTGDTEFTNIASMTDAGLANGTADMTMTYIATAIAGTTDTQNLSVNNVTSGAFLSNGAETIAVTTHTAKSTVTSIASNKLASVTVSGDQDLTITNALDFVANGTATAPGAVVNASAMTGKLAITTTASEVLDITGGTNNDTFTLGGFTANDTIDGGAGTDRIKVTSEIGTALTKMTNIEDVEFEVADIMVGGIGSAGTAADPIVMSGKAVTSAVNFVLDANTATDDDEAFISITNLDDGDTVTIADGGADTTSLAAGVNVLTGVASETSANSLNVVFSGIGAVSADTTNDTGLSRLEMDEQETVSITANKSAAGAAANGVEAIEVATAKTMTFAGAGDLTVSAITNTTALTSLDASAMTGALSITGLDASKINVKMAAKSSTIDMAGLNNDDSITGGAGIADTLTATVTGLTATTGKLTIADVENINLTTSGANTIDASGITGASSVLGVTDNVQTITGFDLGQTIKLGLAADEAATSSEIDVTAADATGAADTLNVKIENTNGTTSSIIDASGIETLALEVIAAGSATLDLTTFEGDNVTVASKTGVTGTGVVALGTLHKNANNVESTYAGSVTTSFASNLLEAATFTGAGTGIQNVTGTSRADTFTIGSTGAIVHVISGGAGTDTVNLTATTGLVNVGSIDAENINVAVTAGTDQTITTSFGTGVDNVTITGGNSLSTFTTGAIVTEVKTVDAGAFEGNMVVDVAADALDTTVTLTGGKLATDELNYQITATGIDYLQSTGIEILDLDINETSTLDLSSASGIVTIDVDLEIAAAKTLTLDGVGSEVILLSASDDASGENTLEAKVTDSTGATDAIAFKIGTGTIDAGVQLKTTDVETVSINADNAADVSLANLTMATAGAVMTLNVTGDSALTISATGADVTTINASGMTVGGSVTQTARTGTTAATYTGSAGDDRFILNGGGDTIAGGAGTADKLDVDFSAIIGGAHVDLSSTTDQLVSINGAAGSGTVTGFESVDLSGYTGSFGALITGSTGANVVHGTTNADQANLGAGNDTYVLDDITADTVNAQTGTADLLVMVAGVDIAVTDDIFAGYTGFEKFTVFESSDTAFSIVAHADFKTDTSIATVDFSGDTSATGNNTIDFGAVDATMTIIGGAGKDSISGSDEDHDMTLEGGGGNDVIISTAAANTDTIKFAATAALNGSDTITFAAGTGKDVLDFTAFGLTAGALNTTAVAIAGTDDINISNKVVMLNGTTEANLDEASEVLALINGAGDALAITSGAKGIVVSGDASGGNDKAQIFFVDDSLGSTAGTVEASEITLVAQTAAAIDLDTIVAGNYSL